jgi:ubiquinone/menaquinone biosynthesis C-methylase UbiE
MYAKFPDLLRLLDPLFDPMFGRPRGPGGRIGGAIMARSNAKTERYAVEQMKLATDETVLVLGPGPGVGPHAAAEATPDGHVIGVDPSPLMRELAADRCHRLIRAGRVELRDGTAEQTGLEKMRVDVALSVNNVHIWPDRAAGFAELFRVLRPGGRLLVSVHDWAQPGCGQEDLRRDAIAAGFADVQAYTLSADSPAGATVQVRATRPTR